MDKGTRNNIILWSTISGVVILVALSVWTITPGQSKRTRINRLCTYEQYKAENDGRPAYQRSSPQKDTERNHLMQQLQILKQKRTAKWAEIEACESTGDGRGCLKLVRLGQEHSDIMDEIHELKRKIRRLN